MTQSPTYPSEKNIVITGFMGTGKTTIGRMLAERLARPFTDMDDLLETEFGKPIARVFAEEGEAAFRNAEAQLCAALAARPGAVISTGGGALVTAQNRETLASTGLIVCLTATADAILARVDNGDERPLLAGDPAERHARVAKLMAARSRAYGAIPHQVNTTGLTPSQVVDGILDILATDQEAPGMSRIPVRVPGGVYDICIGEGLLAHCGALMRHRELHTGSVALVTNPVLAALHGPQVLAALRAGGFSPVLCVIPEGEQYKTLATVASLYGQFVAAGLDRSGAVVALGGGVVGDVAGFAAASYLRGVPFVQIPTSLLAMVDSSVGGKTGVDLPQGKNLVGAFKQPALVVIDPAVLSTLPPVEFRSGLAEVVKHGIIGAPALFAQLEEEGPASVRQLVRDAVQVKVDVVEEDPFEQDRRGLLNLGHTFGHAIEIVSNFAVRHGEGVAIGLVAAAHLAQLMERCPPDLRPRITRLLERLDLPVAAPGLSADAILAVMGHDKKRSGKTLRFVIPQAIGEVVLVDNPGDDLVLRVVNQIVAS